MRDGGRYHAAVVTCLASYSSSVSGSVRGGDGGGGFDLLVLSAREGEGVLGGNECCDCLAVWV